MRIGIVCYPTVGGSGVIATELGHALSARGHEIHFITYEIPFRLQLENPNIYFHCVSISQYDLFQYPDYALPLAVKIAEISEEYSLDVLHVHYAIPHATSAYLARQLSQKKLPAIVTTLHGTDITLIGKDPSYKEIVKFSIEQSDALTAVSNNLKMETKRGLNINKSIQVIYNFFEPKKDVLGSKPFKNSYVKGDEKLLIHNSNMRHIKRVTDVIHIFYLVKKKIPCKLLLIGFGPEMYEIKKMVAELDLTESVYFLGSRIRVDPYVASGDLFLLPSSQESFGLAALEAMAYGVPCVCSNVGGLPELVESEKTGFLANPGEVDTMAQYALKILTNEKLALTMSENCVKRASENFSPKVIIPLYESCYLQAFQSR